MGREKYLYQIDFLKFIFACMIMFYHLVQFLSGYFPDISEYSKLTQRTATIGGAIVIAFFVLSGYFLCRKAFSQPYDPIRFAVDRVKKLWPLLAVSFIPFLLLGTFYVYDFLNILFISDGMGIVNGASHNAATWFICVLFWLSLLFYYLLHNCKEEIVFICSMLAIFGFMWLAKAPSGFYSAVAFPTFQLTSGMLRGIIGISLGILVYFFLSEYNEQKETSLRNNIYFTALELMFLYLTGHYMCDKKPISQDVFYQIILCGLIVCFILNQGYVSSFLNKKFCKILGEWSYGIYVMHFPVIELMKRFIWEKNLISSPTVMMVICSTICIISGGGQPIV